MYICHVACLTCLRIFPQLITVSSVSNLEFSSFPRKQSCIHWIPSIRHLAYCIGKLSEYTHHKRLSCSVVKCVESIHNIDREGVVKNRRRPIVAYVVLGVKGIL